VYIRYLGNGHLWFRSYSDSLCKSGKVTKTLCPPVGASPRLGIPERRHWAEWGSQIKIKSRSSVGAGLPAKNLRAPR